jgi:hypothetical protein
MLKQQAKAKSQFNLIPFRFSAAASGVTRCAACRFFTGAFDVKSPAFSMIRSET